MFHPGETIVHQFIVPFFSNTIKEVIVTYKQNDRLVLTKKVTFFQPYNSKEEERQLTGAPSSSSTEETEEEEPEESLLYVLLSQKESLLFANNQNIKVQLNVLFNSGTRVACDELPISSGIQQYKEVMLNEQS